MSRIGTNVINIPTGTTVTMSGRTVTAKGQHGELSVVCSEAVNIAIEGNRLKVSNATGLKSDKKFHGLYWALINNIVTGVSSGFERKLELVGVGYRANISGKEIVLEVGYSNPVKIPIPEGIRASVENNTAITLWGINRQEIGQFAANIRDVRPPEPYKGKGIRYSTEVVRRKAGKAGAIGKGE